MPLSLSELAARVHLHKATAHRLMRTLEGERLVARDPMSGKYISSNIKKAPFTNAGGCSNPKVDELFSREQVDLR